MKEALTRLERDILCPAIWEIAGLAVLIIFYLASDVLLGENFYPIVNPIGSASFAVILGLGALRMVNTNPIALWLGIFWFRIATAVYFGFGSMMRVFLDPETILLIDSFYWVLPPQVFKTNMIVALGAFLFLSTLYFLALFSRTILREKKKLNQDPLLFAIAVIYCCFGYSVKIILMSLFLTSSYQESIYTSIITNSASLATAGLFLLTRWCIIYGRTIYLVAPVLLLTSDILLGAVLLAKNLVIFPVMVFLIAFLEVKASYWRYFAASLCIIVLFGILVPAVGYGRNELERRYGNWGLGPFEERIEIYADYFSGRANVVESPGTNTWTRLSYGGETAAAIVQYETGQPGQSLRDVFTILIPRVLWPDKPTYDNGGRFNLSVTGSSTSASWMGVFVESYWNLGWFGLPIVMIPMAVGYFILAKLSISIMEGSKWLQFPVILLGIFVGMRVDDNVAQSQFAAIVTALIIYYAGNMIERPFRALIGAPAESDA